MKHVGENARDLHQYTGRIHEAEDNSYVLTIWEILRTGRSSKRIPWTELKSKMDRNGLGPGSFANVTLAKGVSRSGRFNRGGVVLIWTWTEKHPRTREDRERLHMFAYKMP
jgi:hypothetical protein